MTEHPGKRVIEPRKTKNAVISCSGCIPYQDFESFELWENHTCRMGTAWDEKYGKGRKKDG